MQNEYEVSMEIANMKQMTFKRLVESICDVHAKLSAQAARAVNMNLTLRNWLIGMCIAEFKLHGADRAKYGEKIFDELSGKLVRHKVSACGRRQLYNYTAFYRAYPQIVRTVSAQSKALSLPDVKSLVKVRMLSAQYRVEDKREGKIIGHGCEK